MADAGHVDDPPRARPWMVVHPLLTALVAVLWTWGRHVDDVGVQAPRTALLVVLAATLATWATIATGMRIAGRGQVVARAGIATSLLVVVALLGGPLLPAATPWLATAVAIVVVAASLGLALALPQPAVVQATTVATLAGVALVVATALPVLPHVVGPGQPVPTVATPVAVGAGSGDGPGTSRAPDIWYVVPDRYPRADTLGKVFGMDNRPFLDALDQRGFTIQDRARANYPRTASSLAATLQFRPLQEVLTTPPGIGEWGPIYQLIGEQRLGRLLVDLGWDYVHVGTWWGPSTDSVYATTPRPAATAVPLGQRLRQASALSWWTVGGQPPAVDTRAGQRQVALAQVRELHRLAATPSHRPRFVMAHVTVPHEPYVFDADGSWVSAADEAARSREENLTNQVRWVNDVLLDLVDEVLAADPSNPPVIVVQSDEGPHPPAQVADGADMDWFTASTAERAEKLRTLSAWYVPTAGEDPPEDVTGMNTWRWVLDRAIGTEFGLVEDRVWVNRDQAHPWDFRDVTDEFR